MSKYLCINCAATYDHKVGCDLHLEYNPDHLFMKKNYRGRFIDFMLDWYSAKWWRITGFLVLHGVFITHFRYEWWEAILSALALGLIL